ncbi:hypothetical protein C6P40_000873 [Pichia californica]|uniref:Uncharacterized protein n=1 Tax=Pichia californica TaxID=460514 RepID=A0A9P6WK21_9ASCO|nr:hypothetical protein C6P42_000559 [[Candida] californica]KAG0688525.1 hypothetical protein C6P40_000873 [[Candida] californica]
MAPKKGQFPERPPTLGEALYSGKEIGTRPENHEQILKDLNLGSLIPKKEDSKIEDSNKVITKKTISTATNTKSSKSSKSSKEVKSVKQMDAFIDSPIPVENPSTINSTYILPSECEAVTNLLIEYILYRRSTLIQSTIKSRIFSSFALAIFSMISYYKIGDYFTDYTFKKGLLNGIWSLWNNSYFMDDFITMLFIIGIFILGLFTSLKYLASSLQEEADSVPKNFEKYFKTDLTQYSSINIDKNYNKLNKKEKELLNLMKDNTFSIVYKDVPVAFLSVEQVESYSTIDIKINSYGVRRVYVKADLLKDLIAMLFKKFFTENESSKPISSISVQLYNFETYDIDIFKRAGFYRKEKENLGFIMSTILGITKDTYIFESDSIEF